MILGAAYGIGSIGSKAVESMARQPEVASNIQTAMLITAALIEGATFFALIVCMFFNSVPLGPSPTNPALNQSHPDKNSAREFVFCDRESPQC